MKVLVSYSSKNGSTEKIAKAIHNYNRDWDFLNISDEETKQNYDLDSYDLIFLGGWIDKGTFNKEALDFSRIIKNSNIAFFFTLGDYPTTKYSFDCSQNISKIFEENNNIIINYLSCQGAVDEKLIDWMKSLPEGSSHYADKYRELRWKHGKNHPDKEDLDIAESFAHSTLKILDKKNDNNNQKL